MIVTLRLSLTVLVGFYLYEYGHGSQSGQKIRIITWNVGDNSGMNDGFDDEAIDKIFGIDNATRPVADMYVIGLQEQCWNCNEASLLEIPKRFLQRLGKKGTFEIIGVEGTRESRWCEWLCGLNTHGTTALVVIAKQDLVSTHESAHRNDGCSDQFPENDEKGVAYMRMTLSTGKSVCVATSHLESRSPKFRRDCLRNFFVDAKKNQNWPTCDYQFITGDFNTRTTSNPSASSSEGLHIPMGTNLSSLESLDEMAGSNPFGRGKDWSGNLLGYINSIQEKHFQEAPLTFPPTYKVAKAAEYCHGKKPCYRVNRSRSWTDRILFTSGTILKYKSIMMEFSDHFPVIAEFNIS